jgi:hypothetical protein
MNKYLLFVLLIFITRSLPGQNSSAGVDGSITNEVVEVMVPAAAHIRAFQKLFTVNPETHAHVNPSAINPGERENRIASLVENLQSIEAPHNKLSIDMKITDIEDFFQISYRLMGDGYIRFENGDWLFLRSTSSHLNEQVGDITLAIDNRGEIFINEGHVCGGIIHFITHEKKAVKAASDFIQHFMSDTDDQYWSRLDREKSTLLFNGN